MTAGQMDAMSRFDERELSQRLGVEWPSGSDLANLQSRYAQLLHECRDYSPPTDGLLSAYSIEAMGDHTRNWSSVIRAPRPWVCRILGLDLKYEFRREFIRGHYDYRGADKYGASGVMVYYSLSPGLYEIQHVEKPCKMYYGRRFFARVATNVVEEISKGEMLECLRNASKPS